MSEQLTTELIDAAHSVDHALAGLLDGALWPSRDDLIGRMQARTSIVRLLEALNEARARIVALEAERDALAAAVEATPMPSIIENTQPFAPVPADALLKLEWRAGRVYEWWAAREGEVEFARRRLAARDQRMRREGALEALQKLPLSKPYPRLCEYPDEKRAEANAFVDGWNAYSGVVGKAIAALEASDG